MDCQIDTDPKAFLLFESQTLSKSALVVYARLARVQLVSPTEFPAKNLEHEIMLLTPSAFDAGIRPDPAWEWRR